MNMPTAFSSMSAGTSAGGPISEKRIVDYDGDTVTIAYAHPEKHEQPTFKLDAQTFIRRLLEHVPEKGTHLVRS